MRIIDKARCLTTQELTDLLEEHGTVNNVVFLIAGKQYEGVRQVISERIKAENITWSGINRNRYSYTVDALTQAFETAICWSDVYRSLGLTVCDHNKHAVIKYATAHNIPIPTFSKENLTQAYQRGKQGWVNEDIFCVDSKYSRANLRDAVVRRGVIKYYNCSKCDLLPSWDGELLTLELDHINGIHNDNRIENLRWLCPNCHSQTKTFKGKNR